MPEEEEEHKCDECGGDCDCGEGRDNCMTCWACVDEDECDEEED